MQTIKINPLYTFKLTYICSTCGKHFDTKDVYRSKKPMGIRMGGTYCSGRCRKVANLKRGKRQSIKIIHTNFTNSMIDLASKKLNLKYNGSVAEW